MRKFGEDFEGNADVRNMSERDRRFAQQWERFRQQRDAEREMKRL